MVMEVVEHIDTQTERSKQLLNFRSSSPAPRKQKHADIVLSQGVTSWVPWQKHQTPSTSEREVLCQKFPVYEAVIAGVSWYLRVYDLFLSFSFSFLCVISLVVLELTL